MLAEKRILTAFKVIYTNNDFFFTYASHIFNRQIRLVQIRDCHAFRTVLATEKQNLFFLVDSSQMQDDVCWIRMMTETTAPLMIVNPDEKGAPKKLMLLEQSICEMTRSPLHFTDDTSRLSKISGKVMLTDQTFFDIASHCIYTNGEVRLLSTLEFKLLYYLTQNAGKHVPANELVDYLGTSEGVLYIYINKIRSKIEPDPQKPTVLLNERGKGYILKRTA
ncbi:winged helix-turn-helix domain-containing protein [Paenibacillus ehimensis]|uniref:Helix-turn-helix domain-containing protein n=1 Tax=Paenibacillus ehimensis TaxID=79264 RepID=A0ABT8VBU4_9BACL|nr:helix-turn-helix domain-containing protein [Paenibacillus ehimensis]MDO3678469.1 helix-turn-helix domain-containing protein [Paenibacillus ehimensis]